MDESFKSLPPKLFLKLNSLKLEKPGVLWIPPLKQSSITVKLDWLLGLQISNLEYTKPPTWPKTLKTFITDYNLPLDEQPPFNHSNTLIFNLPKGFKSSLGLIVKNSNWSSREDVYSRYKKACESFKTSFFIQSFDFWSSPEITNIEWIKV